MLKCLCWVGVGVGYASETVWHIYRRGERVGPVTQIELAYLAKLGHLDAHDFIWCAGMPDWVEAGTVAGLLPRFNSAPVMPAPQQRPIPNPQAQGGTGPTLTSLYQHYCAAKSGSVEASSLPSPVRENESAVSLTVLNGETMLARIAEALGTMNAR
jgi:hypothetical protein